MVIAAAPCPAPAARGARIFDAGEPEVGTDEVSTAEAGGGEQDPAHARTLAKPPKRGAAREAGALTLPGRSADDRPTRGEAPAGEPGAEQRDDPGSGGSRRRTCPGWGPDCRGGRGAVGGLPPISSPLPNDHLPTALEVRTASPATVRRRWGERAPRLTPSPLPPVA